MVVHLGGLILLSFLTYTKCQITRLSVGEDISYSLEISNLESLVSPHTVPGCETLSHSLCMDSVSLTPHTVMLSACVLPRNSSLQERKSLK